MTKPIRKPPASSAQQHSKLTAQSKPENPLNNSSNSLTGNSPNNAALSNVVQLTSDDALIPIGNADKKAATLPGIFLSHGAPSLACENNATTQALARIGQNLPRPRAIIIMSAHWMSQTLEIANNPQPQTWHDFSGFDEQLRNINYPAKGLPVLAESLARQLTEAGINNSLNPVRPLDHGVWSPLRHLYPDADIPIVQLSLPQYFDAYACYQLGQLFAPLRREQILVIGSGNITHNLNALNWDATTEDSDAKAFKVALLAALRTDKEAALDWRHLSHSDSIHPTAEHILPLFFALGTGSRLSVVHERMAHHSLGMDIYRFD